MKNPLTYLCSVGIAVGALGFVYPPARALIFGAILLLSLALLVNYVREKRSIRQILFAGFLLVPVLIAAFFYKFPADLVLSTLVLFFASIWILSSLQISERRKLFAAYVTFLCALIVATALNYKSIVQLVMER